MELTVSPVENQKAAGEITSSLNDKTNTAKTSESFHDTASIHNVEEYINMDFIKKIVRNNGPDTADHHELKAEIERIGKLLENKAASHEHKKLLDIISPVLAVHTMQGHAYQKPHGYAGDFEIIDKIYTSFKSDDEKYRRWDEFFHAQEAPCAVRNRKTFFLNVLNYFTQDKGSIRVLNVGSGPGRDMLEYFENNQQSTIHIDCIENDKKAVEYASRLCKPHLGQISFINANVFKFRATQKYDVIWSAGLFDYLNDKRFIFLLKKLYSFLKEDGFLYVGNFSDQNPTRKYMELFGNWHLFHRNEQQLRDMALQAGISRANTKISSEPLGINLFLEIFKSDLVL
ncbi:class I SAM-dependent methyltransferase [Chlorobaculum sp. 24CR]|uniref:class I SAM-dependent methyltransferase n=1 Tax=Chlorobaculum sp. 24CR TaxID=2508878 RepID=UPI00100BB7D2|nr:class I SAM-dependent methyltransferase [Chlorobaculum sp. 24CR]RXK84644.1 class I SAM-dependent methyltransferase [Chlorobaculum sp. 24CR]